jgi:iron(III) transport system substrate-binding protein
MTKTRSFVARAFIACAAAFVALAVVTSAQVKPAASPVADIAAYTGADRMQRLIAGAKKEGSVSVYTSLQTADIGKLGAAFEKKYGVKVIPWRGGSEEIVQRSVQEARANRNTVDVIETNGPELESIHRENLLQKIQSPYQRHRRRACAQGLQGHRVDQWHIRSQGTHTAHAARRLW